MAVENAPLLSFNRGVISAHALSRIDIKRVALSAQIQENWMPRVLGSMSLRQGLQYLVNTYNNAAARYLPFLFSITDTALIELTDSTMRVLVGETPISRVAVASAIANSTFPTNLASWTNNSDVGGTVSWAAAGQVVFQGDGTNAASLYQTVTVAGGDIGKMHAVRIVIAAQSDAIHVRIGSTVGGAEYVADAVLLPGTHSFAFTPTGNFTVQLYSRASYPCILNSCAVEAAGILTLPTIWTAADLANIRVDQSADVIFVACKGRAPQRIERHGTYSWSVVEYISNDGPLGNINITPTTLTPSALAGTCSITASKPIFSVNSIDQLVAITSVGQNVVASFSAANVFSNSIQVTGLTARRGFGIVIAGTFVGTVTLQQSIGAPGSWVDITSWTAPISTSYNDSLDNQIVYYRLGIKTGNYTSGTANVTLAYAAGAITGIGRITGYASPTSVTASILKAFGATTASSAWYLGDWSIDFGFPTAVAIHQGRLWWAGKGKMWGTISGSYISNDDSQVGDSGPINETFGSGMVDTIMWLLSSSLFLIGAQSSEYVARSDALDAPLTPTSFNLKTVTTKGSAAVPAFRVDQSVFFVSRTGSRVYEIMSDAYSTAYNLYNAQDLTVLAPEICQPSIVRAAVQRNVDTRAHFVLSDGTVAVLVFDRAEDVKGWVKVTTDGLIEDVVVIPSGPGQAEDNVYYVVNRTVNGSTVRFLEKFSLESETTGKPIARLADAHINFAGAATVTITGLSHLEGKTVVCWGWNTTTPFTDADGNVVGKDFGTFVVTGGAITLPQAVTNACVGLGYQARYQSTKLAYAAQKGTPLNQRKRITHLGLTLRNTHAQGLEFGSDFATLEQMPQVEAGRTVDQNSVWDSYDFDAVEFNGTYDTDSRLCLVANAPRPCTVLAAVVSVETHEKT